MYTYMCVLRLKKVFCETCRTSTNQTDRTYIAKPIW